MYSSADRLTALCGSQLWRLNKRATGRVEMTRPCEGRDGSSILSWRIPSFGEGTRSRDSAIQDFPVIKHACIVQVKNDLRRGFTSHEGSSRGVTNLGGNRQV